MSKHSAVRFLTENDEEKLNGFFAKDKEKTLNAEEIIEGIKWSPNTYLGEFDEVGKLIGIASVHTAYQSFPGVIDGDLMIEKVFVLAQCRNMGYGSELVQEALRLARDKVEDGAKCFAEVPAERVQFFTDMGFEPVNDGVMAIDV